MELPDNSSNFLTEKGSWVWHALHMCELWEVYCLNVWFQGAMHWQGASSVAHQDVGVLRKFPQLHDNRQGAALPTQGPRRSLQKPFHLFSKDLEEKINSKEEEGSCVGFVMGLVCGGVLIKLKATVCVYVCVHIYTYEFDSPSTDTQQTHTHPPILRHTHVNTHLHIHPSIHPSIYLDRWIHIYMITCPPSHSLIHPCKHMHTYPSLYLFICLDTHKPGFICPSSKHIHILPSSVCLPI